MRWRPRSLLGQLLALMLPLTAAVWLATAALTYRDARHELDELLDAHLAQAASLLVLREGRVRDDEHHASRERNDASDGARTERRRHDDEDRRGRGRHAARPADAEATRWQPRTAFQVFHEGQLVQSSSTAPARPFLDPEQAEPGFYSVVIDGARWRVHVAHGAEHDVQVYVGEQIDSRADILHALMGGLLGPMLLALPLLSLGAWWALRRGTAPLRQLGQTLATRSPQALEPVQVHDAPAEMRPMLDALNGLLQRIDALMQSERRFTADAAHELRTPIAAIRTQAQVALGEVDAGERRHALQATIAGCDRATRLVEQLLTLSRLEAGATPALAPLDLAALARQLVAEQAEAAVERDQQIELDAPAPVVVEGNAPLLLALLRNLVDNAIRYSPAGATVAVRVQAVDAQAQLTVEDSGPGLCEADLARLGERFFRVLGSDQPGSGLGWSIVRRIAAVHGAQVTLRRSVRLGGLEVQLGLAAAAARSAA